MTSNAHSQNNEHAIPDGEVLVSKIDLQGSISYCNNTFIEVSGYSREELIGAPHTLFWHPDMPQQVLADLNKTCLYNKPWRGLIKNCCKDGRSYWEEVNITPLIEDGQPRGYVSFRYQPSQAKIHHAEAAYRSIRAGTSKLRLNEGKIIKIENLILRFLPASSIKLRLTIFLSILFSTLLVIGLFSLKEASNSHNTSIAGLKATRREAYALDTARRVELDFKERLKTGNHLLIIRQDNTLFIQHLKKLNQENALFEARLNLLKSSMHKIGLNTELVNKILIEHRQLNQKHRQYLNSAPAHRAARSHTTNEFFNPDDLAMRVEIDNIVSLIQDAQNNRLRALNTSLEEAYKAANNRAIAILTAALLLGLFLSFRFLISIVHPRHDTTKHLKKIIPLQQIFLKTILRLEVFHDRIDEEQRIGSFIMTRMTHIHPSLNPEMRRYIRPAEHLSGDVLIAAFTPNDTVHILLADAIGHGLTAAINVLPLCQTFYDLTNKGFSIDQIAIKLNEMIHQFMPSERFVSATLVSLNRKAKIIEVWNGGIPELQLFSRKGQLQKTWYSQHLPLGILPPPKFSGLTDVFHYEEDCQLCLFSDGLIEATSPDGSPLGNECILAIFAQTAHDARFNAIISHLEQHLQGLAAHDDISLALFDINLDSHIETMGAQLQPIPVKSDDWRIAISLGAHELKYLDIVPLISQIILNIHVTKSHHSALFQILSEIFNHTLDYGVLQLDKNIKLNTDGFTRFLELRDARMQALISGGIEIKLERVFIENRQAVKISVAYTLGVFDYTSIATVKIPTTKLSKNGDDFEVTHDLAYKLEWTENETTAYYLCT
ncbi:MAG: SpoIIE family protein phosphatase [Gallionella sp.]